MPILKFERVNESIEWAKNVIGIDGLTGDATTVSLVDSNGDFKAVVVYTGYTKCNIDMHIAARHGSNWLSRPYFNAAFELPFQVLQVPRVTGLIRASNTTAQGFVDMLGFQYEGRMRKAFPDGEDLVLYGFLQEEFLNHRWRKHEINRAAAGIGAAAK